ncbi:MAG TPA: hypothetical protein VMV46_07875 [Thermoanaerobaculia bacterium]|nr:hypothetical protein [Thermoanaerobaculia bacterium]
MKTIRNASRRPQSVPLPRGRKLYLGPGQTGEIAHEAVDHPPLAALVDSGDLEIVGEGPKAAGGAMGPQRSGAPASGHQSVGRGGRRGDR